MKSKVVTIQEAVNYICDGQRIMVGGFAATGEPREILEAIADRGYVNLTMIAVDAGVFGRGGRERLLREGHVAHLIASHIGLNKAAGTLREQGKMLVDLIPMGTLIEQIRCGGFGLGGVLTQTGVGTVVEQGKRIIDVDGIQYLLESPLRAEVAIVKAAIADESGNLVYRRTGNNFNEMMAMAADIVIAEVDEIVLTGSIDPDLVDTPGVCVDMIVKGTGSCCREGNGLH